MAQSFSSVGELRNFFNKNKQFRLEFLGRLVKLLREYDQTITDDLLTELTLATFRELANQGMASIDPTPPDNGSIDPK